RGGRTRRERERDRGSISARSLARTSTLLHSASGPEVRGSHSLSLSFSFSFSFSPILALLSRSHTRHLVLYLPLASPLNGISVLSDGPRAELRPCTFSLFLSPSAFLIPAVCRNISRALERHRARDRAITMRYEVDIVTNVMEPSTIFRD
ncbi:hypothetical protein X777_03152, partial [Ooceraea biroi]